ncbi:MAG: DUF2510 domain-containing protein [Terrimesophilobacter sp.]
MTQQSLPPFGWYPDPTGLPMLRWWTGTEWTDQLENPRPEIQPAGGYTTQSLGIHERMAS